MCDATDVGEEVMDMLYKKRGSHGLAIHRHERQSVQQVRVVLFTVVVRTVVATAAVRSAFVAVGVRLVVVTMAIRLIGSMAAYVVVDTNATPVDIVGNGSICTVCVSGLWSPPVQAEGASVAPVVATTGNIATERGGEERSRWRGDTGARMVRGGTWEGPLMTGVYCSWPLQSDSHHCVDSSVLPWHFDGTIATRYLWPQGPLKNVDP